MNGSKRRKRRRSIRCQLCTPHRWKGNTRGRLDHATHRQMPAPGVLVPREGPLDPPFVEDEITDAEWEAWGEERLNEEARRHPSYAGPIDVPGPA